MHNAILLSKLAQASISQSGLTLTGNPDVGILTTRKARIAYAECMLILTLAPILIITKP